MLKRVSWNFLDLEKKALNCVPEFVLVLPVILHPGFSNWSSCWGVFFKEKLVTSDRSGSAWVCCLGARSWCIFFRLGSSDCNVLNAPLCSKLRPCSGEILLLVLPLKPSFSPVLTSSSPFLHEEMQLFSLHLLVHIWRQQHVAVL